MWIHNFPYMKATSPQKELFIYRLSYSSLMISFFTLRAKPASLSCVQLTKDGIPGRAIGSFKVMYFLVLHAGQHKLTFWYIFCFIKISLSKLKAFLRKCNGYPPSRHFYS